PVPDCLRRTGGDPCRLAQSGTCHAPPRTGASPDCGLRYRRTRTRDREYLSAPGLEILEWSVEPSQRRKPDDIPCSTADAPRAYPYTCWIISDRGNFGRMATG